MNRCFLTILAIISVCLASAVGQAGSFTLTSTDVRSGFTDKYIYNGFGCSGNNISPELKWSGEPKGTKSFALTVFDPDAPTGSGWWHWVVVNIPASVHELKQGQKMSEISADIVEPHTDFGASGYGGPCPPKGDKPHHYIFSLYALKADKIDVKATAPAAQASFMIKQNSLGEPATFTTRYGRH